VRFGSTIALFAQLLTLGMVTWRRHLPTWITSGMFVPVGTFSSTKRPAVSESAVAIGWPEAVALHGLHSAPSGMASTGAFGTYTRALYRGNVPFGANTVPFSRVVTPGVHSSTWHCSPLHWLPVPGHTPALQAMPSGQPPQSAMPPQPSPITPQ
jgi:hypothetical protein